MPAIHAMNHNVITGALAMIREQETNGPCFRFTYEMDIGKLPGNLAALTLPFDPGERERLECGWLILWNGWDCQRHEQQKSDK